MIAKQISHSVGATWTFHGRFGKLLATLEVDNLSDAMLYDNFGVQRPGRAFYAKLMGALLSADLSAAPPGARRWRV